MFSIKYYPCAFVVNFNLLSCLLESYFSFAGSFLMQQAFNFQGERWKTSMSSNNIFIDFVGFPLISDKTRNGYFVLELGEAPLFSKISSIPPVQY